MNYKIYWAHLPEHTNPMTEGYIGITERKFETRISEHLLNAKNGDKRRFYNAIRKYGNRIIWEIIGNDYSEKIAKFFEFSIRPENRIGWNSAHGGGGGNFIDWTEDLKENHSLIMKDYYSKNCHPWEGRNHSQSTKDKISKNNTGNKRSVENKLLQSEKMSGDKNPMYGKTHTIESRKKISEAKSKKARVSKGYIFRKDCNLYRVQVSKNNKNISFGYYKTEEEAKIYGMIIVELYNMF